MILLLVSITTLMVGCSPSSPTAEEFAAAQNDGTEITAGQTESSTSTEPGQMAADGSQTPLGNQTPTSQTSPSLGAMPGTQASAVSPLPVVGGASSNASNGPSAPAFRPLAADLTSDQLIKLLGEADRIMRALITGESGIKDPGVIESEIKRVVELKRTASERLMNESAADENARVIGQRGYLQAMSHLAAMGDLASAEKLQEFAEEFRNASNPELRSDSRLVLIGFAIESLRHGKEGAASRVLQLMRDVAAKDQTVDVATLMVMGQAKDTLLQYEHVEEASQIRGLILDRFAGSEDTEVARMAAKFASSGFAQLAPELQRLESLRMSIVSPSDEEPTVTPEQWSDALDAVLTESVDLLTVQFLAGMSLECEAIGRNEIADVTYERMQTQLADRQDAIGREARTALQAKRNRQDVLGQKMDPDLPSVSGQPISMSDFAGKVVLMPFWSSAFTDSLAVLPNLQDIQNKHPLDVALVGMNLDLTGTDVRGFMEQNGLTFPSFRSESDTSADITNEVAYQFGAVSLLFVAILDQEGRVASVDFSGEDLTETVEKLLR